MNLAQRFVELLGREIGAPNLELALDQAVTGARAAWPDLDLSTDDFLRFLARHYPATEDAMQALGEMHTSDMYLVAACVAGNTRAIELFEREFLLAHSPTLIRLNLAPDLLEETRQILRHRFLIGPEPKLAEYSGTGSLRGWVRVATVRTAFTLGRKPAGLVEADAETLANIASPERNLELDYLKRHYGSAAKEVLRDALMLLSVRERNLLRQSFALAMSIDELALVYGVHRSTVARWIAAARDALVAETRAQIKRQLAVSEDDISSVLELIQSQLGDALGEVLGGTDTAPST